jgi:pimeloyl-ACP methyl ester carboxylesterase
MRAPALKTEYSQRYRVVLLATRGSAPKLFCVHAKKRRIFSGVIVHFHGGPESYEWGERRFDGAFESVIDDGFLYVGWNYAGSQGFGNNFQRRPWKRWSQVLEQEWKAGRQMIQRRFGSTPDCWKVVGTSFGSVPALLAARRDPSIHRVVLVSPLLDLGIQKKRASVDSEQREWFEKRFGLRDLRDCSFSSRLHQLSQPITIISSERDEVLPPRLPRIATFNARKRGKKNIALWVQPKSFHFPQTIALRVQRKNKIREALNEFFRSSAFLIE